MEIYIGIPCYGVAKSISGVLSRLLAVRPDLNIILVNDGSKDNLDEVIEKTDKKSFKSFTYHKHPQNKGYGGAQKTIFGIFKSLANSKNDLLILVHGDGQTLESEIERFIEEAKNNPDTDVILGSRMLNPFITQWRCGRPAFKIFSDYVLTLIENHLYNLSLSTYASGYRCFTKKGLDKIDFTDTSDKHVFDTESLILFRFFNVKYKEIPVKVVLNDTGLSANNLKNYAKNTIDLALKYAYMWKKRAVRYLIINSDDYGYSMSINEGISRAITQGHISGTSLLANAEFFNDAILRAKNGKYLDKIGVHINLTEGKPLGKNYKTLTDSDGNLLGISKLIINSILNKINADEVHKEIELQIEKCIEQGVGLSHIDTHQWSQIINLVSNEIIRSAEKHKIGYIRNVNEKFVISNLVGIMPRSFFNLVIVKLFGWKNLKEIRKSSISTSDQYYGIALTGNMFYQSKLINSISKLRPGTTELMCHIGYGNLSDTKNKSYFTQKRGVEFEAISSESFRKALETNKVKLISHKELKTL